mmetsp:Transcript_24740/g.72327  ORF Transcript_24740/g.72327 Transcript_24740/m.72327 type:complete len:300 (-) Transcript_24740:295-1194(-)
MRRLGGQRLGRPPHKIERADAGCPQGEGVPDRGSVREQDLLLGHLPHARTQPNVDGDALLVRPQLLQRRLLQVPVERHQHLVGRLQQHHPHEPLQVLVQPRDVLRHKVAQLAAQLDAGRPRADHHEGELLPPLLLAQAGQRGLLEGVAQLLAKRNRVRELLHEQAVLLDSFDAKRVCRRADGHDEQVVGHLEIAQLAAHPLTHHALASDHFGDGVDGRRLRLKVGRCRVRLADWLDDAARLQRAEGGAREHGREEEVVARRHDRHVARRVLQLREHRIGAPTRTQHDHPRPLSLWRRAT